MLEKSLSEDLKYAHDGAGIDIDRTFHGMEVVDRIANILKKVDLQEVRELYFSAGSDIQQFLIDEENLNDLEFHRIRNITPDLICNMDNILNHLLTVQNVTVKIYEDRVESNKKEYQNKKKDYEDLRKEVERVRPLKDLIMKLERFNENTVSCFNLKKEIMEQMPLNDSSWIQLHPKEASKKPKERIEEKEKMLEEISIQLKTGT